MRFNCKAEHCPGKTLIVADTLSRKPLTCHDSAFDLIVDSVISYESQIIHNLPIKVTRLDKVRSQSAGDHVLQKVKNYIIHGWATHATDVTLAARQYFGHRSFLSVIDDILMYGNRIIVPSNMRSEMLNLLHEGYFGINKCRARAQITVWWPGISSDIKQMIINCVHCQVNASNHHREPLIASELPSRPWEKVGSDLFTLHGKNYITVVDYYSKFIEILPLVGPPNSKTVVNALKEIFSRHGIPDVLMTDNGPQYSSEEFKKYARDCDFNHTTSSPHFRQSNGLAERAVRTATSILRTNDPLAALMNYRATPIQSVDVSPSELLYGRKIKTKLPAPANSLKPRLCNSNQIRMSDKRYKAKYTNTYNSAHNARHLSHLEPGQYVRI
ncbi:Uncharacterised protein r2_g2626 [Pycnogonum litorale]